MNGTAIAVLTVASSLLSGAGGAWVTGRWEAKTQGVKAVIDEGALELDERRADGEAYERAEKSYLQLISTLQQEITRLDRIIQGLRSDLSSSEQHRADLEGRVRDLEESAATMRRLLKAAGVVYPPTPTAALEDR